MKRRRRKKTRVAKIHQKEELFSSDSFFSTQIYIIYIYECECKQIMIVADRNYSFFSFHFLTTLLHLQQTRENEQKWESEREKKVFFSKCNNDHSGSDELRQWIFETFFWLLLLLELWKLLESDGEWRERERKGEKEGGREKRIEWEVGELFHKQKSFKVKQKRWIFNAHPLPIIVPYLCLKQKTTKLWREREKEGIGREKECHL